MEENQPIQASKSIKKEGKHCPLWITITLGVIAICGIAFGIIQYITIHTQVDCITSTMTTEDIRETKAETETEAGIVAENNQENDSEQNQEDTTSSEQTSNISEYNSWTIYPILKSEDGTYEKVYYKRGGFEDMSYYDVTTNSRRYFNLECRSQECEILEYKTTYQTPEGYTVHTDEQPYANISNFSGQIRSYSWQPFGQAGGSEFLLFILQDGSVEYLQFFIAVRDNDFQVKKIEGLNNIIAIHDVRAGVVSGVGGGVSALAEDKDGNYYDLSDYLDV